uniref:Methyltransferase type 11 domain-containing protein n=1 Tax=Zea mays TaxID=4577 RepID=A0A804NEQ1_MAIZE
MSSPICVVSIPYTARTTFGAPSLARSKGLRFTTVDPYYPHRHPEGASKQLTFTEFFDNAPQRFYSTQTRLNASSSVSPLLRPFPGDESGLGFLYLEPPPPLSCPLPPPPYGWCSGLRDFCRHRAPTRFYLRGHWIGRAWSDEATLSRLVGALIAFKPLYSVLKLASREVIIRTAEKSNIPWREMTKEVLESDVCEVFERIQDPNLVYPDYYLNPFHAYDEGNLSWLVNDILDIGCSVGVSTRYLAEKFPSAQAVEEKLSRPKPIRWVHANGEVTGLSSDSFDLVSLAYVCHECPARAITGLVKEAFRVLRPGGTIALTDNSCGRADGYILEGKELEFYMKKLQRTGDAEDQGDDEVSGLRVAAEAWATFRRQRGLLRRFFLTSSGVPYDVLTSPKAMARRSLWYMSARALASSSMSWSTWHATYPIAWICAWSSRTFVYASHRLAWTAVSSSPAERRSPLLEDPPLVAASAELEVRGTGCSGAPDWRDWPTGSRDDGGQAGGDLGRRWGLLDWRKLEPE